MSNQFGLILSFLFLSVFITLSSDIFSYQSFTTTFYSQTMSIVNDIQKNGYNKYRTDELVEKYEIDLFQIDKVTQTDFVQYKILFVKNYESKLFIDNTLDRKVVKRYEIFRKE